MQWGEKCPGSECEEAVYRAYLAGNVVVGEEKEEARNKKR